jgi:hypothetical protein
VCKEAFLNTRGLEIKESWKTKLRKIFFQGIDIKDQKYALRQENKIIRCQNKEIMRNMGIPTTSVSKDNLTASDEWKGKYTDWDNDASSSRQAVAPGREEI